MLHWHASLDLLQSRRLYSGELVSFLGSGVAGDAAKRLVLVPEAMDEYTGEGVVPDDELKPPFSQINGSIKSAGAHSGMILSGIEMLTSTGRMLHGLWSAIVGEPKPGEVLYVYFVHQARVGVTSSWVACVCSCGRMD